MIDEKLTLGNQLEDTLGIVFPYNTIKTYEEFIL